MNIKKIIIENFKGLKKVELILINPINVLIGHNNCGKSSILECLDLFCKHFNIEEKVFRIQRGLSGEKIDKSLPENVFNLRKEPILITIQIGLENLDDRKNIIYKSVEYWNKKYDRPKMSTDVANDLISEKFLSNLSCQFEANSYKSGFALSEVYTNFSSKSLAFKSQKIIIGKGDIRNFNVNNIKALLEGGTHITTDDRIKRFCMYETEKDSNTEFKSIWIDDIYGYLKAVFRSSFIINSYRHGQSETNPQFTEELATDGNNLVQYLHNLALNNNKLFEEIAAFVKTVLPEVGRLHPRFTKDNTGKLELAYEWEDGRIVNLANMGGGVEQILILGSMLINQKKTFILIEEPESHLHPGAQEVLLSLIEKYIGDSRIFLTTHSPVFIKHRDVISIHAIKNHEGKNAIGSTIALKDFNEILTLIGSRPGHLAQADIVLYVEGKYGSVVVEEWLEKWPEKNNVLGCLQLVVQSINADEVGSKDLDISKLKKVTPNMIIFADKDNDPDCKEPKKIRLDLGDKCKTNGIPFILTEKRQIEDYFTADAVKNSLPPSMSWQYDESKPMNEQYPSKKFNRSVASNMNWGDIVKHKDIMSIFDEIIKFATKLKPNIDTK